MAQPETVNATDFARNFAEYQHRAARSGVIVVTSHRRVVGGYLSASELEHYERLKAREREILRIEDLDDETLAQIAAAEYGALPR